MPANNSPHSFGAARLVLSVAVAVLVLLVAWIAARAVGSAEASRQPAVVLPSMPQMRLPLTETTASPSPVPTPSFEPSTPSRAFEPPLARPAAPPARSTRPPARSTPPGRATTTPAPSKTRPTTRPAPTRPAPRVEAAATLTVRASRGRGYAATGSVTNNGTAPLQWRVTVTHPAGDDVRLRGVRGATASQSGNTLLFQGGPLAPGASAQFGYRVSRDGRRGDARPSGCSVVGGTCQMR